VLYFAQFFEEQNDFKFKDIIAVSGLLNDTIVDNSQTGNLIEKKTSTVANG